MINEFALEKCHEVYEVEKTIDVVVTLKSSQESRRIRIPKFSIGNFGYEV